MTSAALVERVVAGERDLYRQLVRRHQLDVYRVIAAFMQDRAATENLVQQTFINAYERLRQFDRERDFGVWIKAIARHVACDELRRSRREARRLGQYGRHLMALTSSGGDDLGRVGEALEDCRRGLSPVAARALSLRYEQALDVPEVAQALGRSANATHQLLLRVRVAMRRCIEARLARS